MANSLFRRFPGGDLEHDLPEWEGVNLDGQAFIKARAGDAAWDICEDFWEVSGAASYSLTAEAGACVLAGQAAGVRVARMLPASAGSIALTGAAGTLVRGYQLAASAGVVALTGSPASFIRSYRLSSASAACALHGTDAALLRGYLLTGESASAVMVGQNAALIYAANQENWAVACSSVKRTTILS